MKINAGISVIICCYNSAKRISRTLEHLAKQSLPVDLEWEIILVDNLCTDNTVEVAGTTWASIETTEKPELVIIKESKAGLSYARIAGIKKAKFEILCFCDDDNWLHEDYLARAYTKMQEDNEIGVLAGRGIPFSDVHIPEWFKSMEANYACGELADESGEVTSGKFLWGAGMILRNSYITRLFEAGFEHLSSDRVGKSLSSGGDTEICYWHILTGKKLWYDKDLVFTHFITPEKMNLDTALELEKWHNLSLQQLYPYFPLIYGSERKKENSIFYFLKTFYKFLFGIDDQYAFVRYQLLFRSRINIKTLEILDHIQKFRSAI